MTGYAEGDKIESTLVDATVTLKSLNYELYDLCLDPVDDNSVYAVVYHGVARITLDPPAASVVWGGPSKGFTDDVRHYAKFNKPISCTTFGSFLAVGQQGNYDDAIRLIDPITEEVTTLIDYGAAGFRDGVFSPGTGTGAGVSYPEYLTAINSTHLVVCSNIAKVRLIDTVSSTISTLVDSVTSVRIFYNYSYPTYQQVKP